VSSKKKKQLIVIGILALIVLAILINEFLIKGIAPDSSKQATGNQASSQTDPFSTGQPRTNPRRPVSRPPLPEEPPAPVDLDTLLAQVEEVDFDYQRERSRLTP